MRLEINGYPYVVDTVNERLLRRTMNCLRTVEELPDFTPIENLSDLESVKLFDDNGEEIKLAFYYNYLVDVSITRSPVQSFAITVKEKTETIPINISELIKLGGSDAR